MLLTGAVVVQSARLVFMVDEVAEQRLSPLRPVLLAADLPEPLQHRMRRKVVGDGTVDGLGLRHVRRADGLLDR